MDPQATGQPGPGDGAGPGGAVRGVHRAEEIHASGVLAVVVAGFVVGNGTLGAGYQTRLQERYVWNSVDVLLEAFVFAYIGLHLRFVLEDLREAHESLARWRSPR